MQAIREKPWRPCEVCSSSSAKVRYRKNGLEIVRCSQCGLGYVPYLLTPADLAAFYDRRYYEGGVYQDYGGRADARRGGFRSRLDKLASILPTGARVLDCGAAFGFFVEEALAAGFDAEGVELSREAVAEAQARSLPVRHGTLETSGLPDERFDLTTLWDTLEHLTSPRSTLSEVYRVLKPNGLVVITTANWRSLSAWVYRDRWSMIWPPYHLFYFDPTNLARLLELVGFADVSVETPTPLLRERHWDKRRLKYRIAERIYGNRWAQLISRRAKLGDELYVTARKPAQ